MTAAMARSKPSDMYIHMEETQNVLSQIDHGTQFEMRPSLATSLRIDRCGASPRISQQILQTKLLHYLFFFSSEAGLNFFKIPLLEDFGTS